MSRDASNCSRTSLLRPAALLALACLLIALPAQASSPPATPQLATQKPAAARSGSEIYARFHEHLAQPDCSTDATARWRKHFASAPGRLASSKDDALPLFGYVVDSLIASGLPTEYALIPFVESGYRPGARSPGGPAGLWQMIGVTARNHGVPIRQGFDGRLSPVESTRAAVRYLKTLHGMFAGDWRLAAMAYNTGENRVLGALRRSGQQARNAEPHTLPGIPDITRAYVRKLHALACVLDEADDRAQWRAAIDRQVPLLTDVSLPEGTTLQSWAQRHGIDLSALRRMNPAFGDAPARNGSRVLAPATESLRDFWPTFELDADASTKPDATPSTGRTHTVRSGESATVIARRYRIPIARFLQINKLKPTSVLRPGMVMQLE